MGGWTFIDGLSCWSKTLGELFLELMQLMKILRLHLVHDNPKSIMWDVLALGIFCSIRSNGSDDTDTHALAFSLLTS